MQKLVQGVHAFQSQYFSKHKKLFKKLAEGQNPETLFITCSDSRVVPHLITDTQPGDLFLVRNIGNVVPHPSLPGGTAAAVEYAVEVLGVQNVVVCGHTLCGAMRSLLEPETIAKLPFVKKWVDQTENVRAIVRERYSHLTGNELLTAAVEENVLVQLEHLREFTFVSDRLDKGALRLAGWVFKLETGEVFEFEPEAGQFLAIGADRQPSSRPPPVK
jgi:carbonic anhydrase